MTRTHSGGGSGAAPLFPRVATGLLVLLASVFLFGCQSAGAGGLFLRKTTTVVAPGSTNYVPILVTNYVGVTRYLTNYVTVQAATTNAQTGEVTAAVIQPLISTTNAVQAVVETKLQPIILPAKTYDALSLAPTVTGAVQIAGDMAPVPWASGAGSLLLAAASTVLAVINQRRAKKANDEKATWKDTANTVVANFETLRSAAKKLPGYSEAWDTEIMRVVQGVQHAVGVKETVADLVQEQKFQSVS